MKRYFIASLLLASSLLFATKVSDSVWRMPSSGTVPAWGTVNLSASAAVSGQLPSVYGGVPVGVSMEFEGTTAPSGYVFEDGSSLLRAGTYAALYAVISCNSGCADGTHFNVPDRRGKIPRGTDNMGTGLGAAGNDPDTASRTACKTGGNSGDNVGSCQASAMLTHNHSGTTFASSSHKHNLPFGNSGTTLLILESASNTYIYGGSGIITTPNAVTSATWSSSYPSTGVFVPYTDTPNATTAIPNDGSSTESRPINVYTNYIIKY